MSFPTVIEGMDEQDLPAGVSRKGCHERPEPPEHFSDTPKWFNTREIPCEISETPETDTLREAIDNGAAVEAEMTSLAGKLERERNNLEDQRDFCMGEIEDLKKKLDASEWECVERGKDIETLKSALKGAREERDQWKADCLEQCQLLAQSADREEKMIAKTGYWESLIHWLELVQKAHEGKDRTWDLTQIYMRGPFAGWSQERMVRLADELWQNEQEWPLRGDKK